MSAQESNLVRQARSEEEELKVTKKRKHDEGKETAAICSINTITQKITQEHGIMVNDLNSRSELTPKNLAITSPESGKVNNTEKEMDPGQITGMNIDENESEQYVDPEMIVENEDMAGSTGIAWEEEAESKLGLVKGTRTYSQVTRGDDVRQRKRREPTDMAWADEVVERLESSIESEFDEKEWHYENILEAFTNEEKMCDFVKHKLENKPITHAIPPAIATKFKYLDRKFFRTFTRNKRIMPAHQKEFDEIFNLAIANYKGKHNVMVTNREIRDKINRKVRQKIAINFLTNYRMKKRPQEIARVLNYCMGFMKIESDLKGDKMWEAIKKAIQNTLKTLPSTPEEIPEEIRNVFPFELPIRNRENLKAVLAAMRKVYEFSYLPEEIFVPLERLPEDPAELKYNLGKLFPVKDRKKLKEIIKMKKYLAEYYIWDRKLPKLYFDLPAKKRPLPTTPQELSSRFCEFFPIDLAKSEKTIREVVDMLREDYHFQVILNNYFIQKRRLPRDPSRIQTNTTFIYPIEDTIEATKFIEEAGLRYSISYPILRKIMTANPTDKPTLPLDHNEIKEFNLTVPIATTKQLVETVRLLRTKYYFHRIPEEWIQIVKVVKNGNEERKDTEIAEDTQNQAIRVDMPESLEEVKLYLEQLEITENTIKIPITEQSEVKSTIEELKKIFDVGKVPNFIFALPPLPKPTWDIIP
ncbi:hypothetical protein C2G38_2167209 [Gigaspora rosea]|uniref:Uncharacterized protein n=1 Tax=Gigaspora rosea TaxID=44941 RepID=A0A397VR16_9GLOM|nr:hypothetical protein C2G38_2167208 [Gigaspora rosea]RIB24970.1 hypothetical protein C2G38_2167209 [Gigaspora rosea]